MTGDCSLDATFCCHFELHLNLHLCLQFLFVSSEKKHGTTVHPWRSRIVLDHQYRAAIALNLAVRTLLYGKNFLSFLDGVDQCNRPFGTRSKCHGLSLDLSFGLSLMYASLDLI